jgi:1,6-anhydro-N-acetylmuramate kinase
MLKHTYMNEMMPELKVPDRCRTCPNVLKAREDMDKNSKEVDERIMVAVSDDPERASETLLKMTRGADGEDASTQTAGELAEALRFLLSHDVEELEAQTGDMRRDVEAFALGCLGAFTLRDSRDGRRDVAVTICQSPRIDDGTQRESAIVTQYLRQ